MKQTKASGNAKRVVILEKDSRFLSDMRDALRGDPELQIIGEGTDLPRATALLTDELDEAPDIIIAGLDLLKEAVLRNLDGLMALKDKMPGTRLIVTSDRYADEEIFRMIHEGIRGFFLKGTPPALITKCVRVALSGGMWMDNAFIARVFEAVANRDEKTGKGSSRNGTV